MQTTIICAAFGGMALKLLELMELAKIPKAQRPSFKDFFFWLPFFLWPLFGIVLAYVYAISGIELKPLLAFNIGISAPLILKSMIQSIPIQPKTINPGKDA